MSVFTCVHSWLELLLRIDLAQGLDAILEQRNIEATLREQKGRCATAAAGITIDNVAAAGIEAVGLLAQLGQWNVDAALETGALVFALQPHVDESGAGLHVRQRL